MEMNYGNLKLLVVIFNHQEGNSLENKVKKKKRKQYRSRERRFLQTVFAQLAQLIPESRLTHTVRKSLLHMPVLIQDYLESKGHKRAVLSLCDAEETHTKGISVILIKINLLDSLIQSDVNRLLLGFDQIWLVFRLTIGTPPYT